METDVFVRDKENNETLPVLIFPEWKGIPGIRHCFTTRMGGVSSGFLSSLNLGWERGDEPENVRENFRRVGEYFHTSPDRIVSAKQTHADHVRVVTEKDAGKGVTVDRDYTDVDALVTNTPGLVLYTSHADCTPLYFYDPAKKVIALAHSGWRGTVAKIAAKTVRSMSEQFGCDPETILVAIGPVICRDCYEVSEDVAVAFREAGLSEALFPGKTEGKYQLDLAAACRETLIEEGILVQHITNGEMCTQCHANLLFSHRATNGKRGNCGAFLMLERDCGSNISK